MRSAVQEPCDAQVERDGAMILPGADSTSTPSLPTPRATTVDGGQGLFAAQCSRAPVDSLLAVLADAVDDLEALRQATDNRLRVLLDESVHGKGLAESPEAERMRTVAQTILVLEEGATKDLERAMRRHPLGPHAMRTKGLGLKQAARLIAAIGDPAKRPNPAKLWQYCGHGDPARSHCRKGIPVEHSPTAKMRVHLCAESAVRAGVRKLDGCDDSDGYDLAHRHAASPLGEVYLAARAAWADRDTTDAHRHNHALRVVGKRILLDLWREARRLQEASR